MGGDGIFFKIFTATTAEKVVYGEPWEKIEQVVSTIQVLCLTIISYCSAKNHAQS